MSLARVNFACRSAELRLLFLVLVHGAFCVSSTVSRAICSRMTGAGGFHLEGFLNFECAKGAFMWALVFYCGRFNFSTAKCLLILKWNLERSSVILPMSGFEGVSTKFRPLESKLCSASFKSLEERLTTLEKQFSTLLVDKLELLTFE